MEYTDRERRLILLDAVTGCLFGGAYGDAMGYPIEFTKYNSIVNIYGEEGVTELQFRNERAQISDDTQMTLFTANGILYGHTRGCLRGIAGPLSSYVFKAYQEWRETQINPYSELQTMQTCWIYNNQELHSMRAPGSTCMSAIATSNGKGSTFNPINDSKGCGGVMRVAPIGCFAACGHMRENSAMIEAAEISALTHGHPLGYIPAAYLSLLIYKIITNKFCEKALTLKELSLETLEKVKSCYGEKEHFDEFEQLVYRAVKLSESNTKDILSIKELGEGWVAEEALAIGLYSALKYSENFMDCLICAVNHDGDSDSTGSIAGNIIGAYLGAESIDMSTCEKEGTDLRKIEANDVIFEISQDLVDGCQMSEYGKGYDAKWMAKYVYCTYLKS